MDVVGGSEQMRGQERMVICIGILQEKKNRMENRDVCAEKER